MYLRGLERTNRGIEGSLTDHFRIAGEICRQKFQVFWFEKVLPMRDNLVFEVWLLEDLFLIHNLQNSVSLE